jgi:hypothetical protein
MSGSILRFSSLYGLKSDFDLKGEVLKISSSFLYPSVFAIPANQRDSSLFVTATKTQH